MGTREPRLAVVVPLHRQPGLVIEALESLLAQRGAPPFATIVVIDGCPMAESDRVCARYLLAHPGQTLVFRQVHKGLSAARNAGVRTALAAWPTLEAIYFLDADNRLDPRALERLWDALGTGADWAYPDIDMIGMTGNYDYGGRYSPLNHLAESVCEAGSLVHRRVFEAGIWFDETMRLGFEDWDFWQRAAARGFRGVHARWVGFRYRRRPESMLAKSNRMREALVAKITRSERNWWRVRSALAVEHIETPRYAIALLGDPPRIGLATDARRWSASLTVEGLVETIAAWATDPRRFRCPPFVVALERTWLDAREFRVRLPGLLWRAEEIITHDDSACAGGGFAMVSTERLLGAAPLESQTEVSTGQSWPDPDDALALIRGLHDALEPVRVRAHRPWNWRASSTKPSSAAYLGLRHLAGGGPVLPVVADRPALALIADQWPAEGFDAAIQSAFALAESGWELHLMLASDPRGVDDSRFATVTVFAETPDSESATTVGSAYFGTCLPALWARPDRHSRLVGLLAGMNAVMNLGVHALSAIMSPLGELGVRRWLALGDRQAAVQDSALGLAFEHCYDGFLAPSKQYCDRLRGGGIPAVKLGATFP